jgi:AcrR family transcriptional regulator
MTKDDKREAIIQAASEQFRQYGYRKTAMDDISKRMGISRASLYSYFDNKDEIFRNVSLSIHERALNRAQEHLVVEAVELKASRHCRSVLRTRCWRDIAHFKKQWLNLTMVMNCSTNTVVFVVISCTTRMRVFRRYWHQR